MPSDRLDRIERWMQAVIMHPGGVPSGIESDAAQLQLPVSIEHADRVITRSLALTSIERLEIYANAYYARLLECLHEEFPTLVHAVGDEAFDALAIGYLQHYPSTSYTLAELGGDFPKYLAESRPTNDAEDETFEAWTDFLIDLATLERLYGEVFDGPGVEGQSLLNATQVAGITADRWPSARLVPACCLKLVQLRYPAHEYISAVRRREDPPPPEPEETYLAVTRRDFVIRRIPLSHVQFALLSPLVNGEPVGKAIESMAELFDGDLSEMAASLQVWFSDWAAAGFFQSVELPSQN